jgi:hypothetical protein
MIEVYVLSAVLVVFGLYINFLNWRLGRLSAEIETLRMVAEAYAECIGEGEDGN